MALYHMCGRQETPAQAQALSLSSLWCVLQNSLVRTGPQGALIDINITADPFSPAEEYYFGGYAPSAMFRVLLCF